ncbi:hypothetical protein MA16_Dca026055 [Dendrobium catenatum]|uniref:Uncharacterized protein n=1 Tax=Dendrobium catenatum TaxID=906689 RepID=A0A2I0VF02_9ASPA|nr:hypothetical protein MA16_Dca026055 [Dendrobium catenatum]
MTVLDYSHILIKLSNDLDYCRVFCHRSYLVFNCFMKITKWSPTLDIGVESPIIPIWISFPHLHPHFFAPRILYGLAELFGKPLKIDEATSVGSRPSNARVLVEIDITKSYTKQVWLGSETLGYVQDVVFDEFPHFCSVCKCLGHVSGKCKDDVTVGKMAIANNSVVSLPDVGVINEGVDGSAVPEKVNTVIINSELDGVNLLNEEPVSVSLAVGIVPINLSNMEAVCVNPLLVGDVNAGGCVLSHMATPFFPADSSIVSELEAVDLNHPLAVPVQDVVAKPVISASFLEVPVEHALSSAALDLSAGVNDVVPVEKLNEVSKNFNQFVNVLIHTAATLSMVNSVYCEGPDHLNWHYDSSEGDFVSDHSDFEFLSTDLCGGSDPGNDFSLVCAKKVSRGRGRGRGRGRDRRRR